MPADLILEGERLYALDRCAVLDTPREPGFDRIVRLAIRLTGCPIAFISFIDDQRQWFKAQEGIRIVELPRDAGLCARVIEGDGAVVLADIAEDPHVASSPLVAEAGGVQSLAAATICSDTGLPIGLIAVMDTVRQDFSDAEIAALADLAACVEDLLALRLVKLDFHHANEAVKTLQEKLAQSADFDPLTGALTRHAFIAASERELRRARRYRRPASVLLVDVDKFQRVNKTFGYRTGDAVLAKLAGVLRGRLREPDLLGRYAGDQFAVFLPESDADAAAEVADRLRSDSGDNEVATSDGMFRFAISVGLSPVDIGADMIDEALDRAEADLKSRRQAAQPGATALDDDAGAPGALSFNAAAIPE